MAKSLRPALESKPRLVFAWLAGQMFALSLLHHLANIWEWDFGRRIAVVLLVGIALTIVLVLALTPIWKQLSAIPARRWIAFGIPAVLISCVVARQVFRAPETDHDLSIVPHLDSPTAEVRIREIRAAYGNSTDLNGLSSARGWTLQDGLLIAAGDEAAPLHLRFRGPVGEQIRVSFITSDHGGTAYVKLDGRGAELDLLGPDGNETRARLDTQYHWGILNPAFLPTLAMIDALGTLAFLAVIWALHELGTAARSASRIPAATGIRAHALGLVLVCLIAVVLHAWSFVTVPLRVTKDGPSYLQGALHYAEHGNLDGAASYRGPGTTFLFAPSIRILGRNPLGVKLSLHLLAIGCVPLAYAIGWGLAKRQGVATASGMLTALSPDLYAYANDVLSEVPHTFSLLLFGATLLYALRHRSFGAVLACMLAGSLAVLVRPDNMVALGLGVVLLYLSAWIAGNPGPRGANHEFRRGLRLRALLISGVIAALPLIAWSAHNLRVHGFFGISDYVGAVLYDGWVYYGENSGIPILDRDSNAVREIDAIFPIVVPVGEQPTSWAVHDALRVHGRTSFEAFSLLGEVSVDSIRRHPDRAWQVLLLKLREAPVPQATLPVTWSGPAGSNPYADLTRQYFDPETWLLPSQERAASWSREVLQQAYGPWYAFWLTMGLVGLWLGIYRRPTLIWMGYVLLCGNALLLPILVGVASWRYLIPGIVLLGPLAFAALDAIVSSVAAYVRQRQAPLSLSWE